MVIIIILIALIFWFRILTGLFVVGSLAKRGLERFGEAIDNNIEKERNMTLKQRLIRVLIFFFIGMLAFIYLQ